MPGLALTSLKVPYLLFVVQGTEGCTTTPGWHFPVNPIFHYKLFSTLKLVLDSSWSCFYNWLEKQGAEIVRRRRQGNRGLRVRTGEQYTISFCYLIQRYTYYIHCVCVYSNIVCLCVYFIKIILLLPFLWEVWGCSAGSQACSTAHFREPHPHPRPWITVKKLLCANKLNTTIPKVYSWMIWITKQAVAVCAPNPSTQEIEAGGSLN